MNGTELNGNYQTDEDVLARKIAGEVLLVPIRGKLADMQRIFSLNTMAEFIWNRLDGKTTLKQIHQQILAKYDVSETTADNDLRAFIDALLAENLIQISE